MPTLYGAWVGSGYQARIRCVYTVTYTADHTQAIYNGTLYFEDEASVSDHSNSWSVSGDDGAHSGSNLSIDIPSGGGVKAFYVFSFQKAADGVISGSVASVEAVGATVSATFTLDSGALAPYFLNTNYVASSITPTAFTVSGTSATGNGGTLTNLQVEYNTSASDTGASYYLKGSYAAPTVTGLTPNTTYYFRERVYNNTYGWSAWGPWKNFKTLSGVPGTPDTGWYVSSVDQISATIAGNTATDTGSAITAWQVQWNTTADATGASDYTNSDPAVAGPITALLPGTTYYARIRAMNANGYGAYSDWKSFTTLPGVSVKVSGSWKNAIPFVRVGGVWKPAIRYVKVGGTWKQ